MRVQVGLHSTYPWSDASAAMALQEEYGVDWVTIALPRWGDSITGFACQLDGACLGDAVSVPFRSAPCREIRVQARLRNRIRLLQPAVAGARPQVTAALKLTLTGPYTLARLARLETTAYRDWRHLAEDLANHLADEIRAAVAAGADWVEIDEPAILRSAEDIRLLRELLEPIQDAVEPDATLLVATYGGAVGGLFAHLNSLPGAAVGFDCVSSPEVIDDLEATGSGKPLALGLVGASSLPSLEEILRAIDRATRRYGHDVVYLQPADGLETMEEPQARRAMALLVAARAQLSRP